MRTQIVALIEYPEGIERGGARLLGRTSDPSLVEKVRERLATERRLDLLKLTPPNRFAKDETPIRLVPNDDEGAVE